MTESKMMLISLATLIRETRDIEKVYATIVDMVNADGINLPPLKPTNEKPDGGKE